jgi:hypothetical protein
VWRLIGLHSPLAGSCWWLKVNVGYEPPGAVETKGAGKGFVGLEELFLTHPTPSLKNPEMKFHIYPRFPKFLAVQQMCSGRVAARPAKCHKRTGYP